MRSEWPVADASLPMSWASSWFYTHHDLSHYCGLTRHIQSCMQSQGDGNLKRSRLSLTGGNGARGSRIVRVSVALPEDLQVPQSSAKPARSIASRFGLTSGVTLTSSNLSLNTKDKRVSARWNLKLRGGSSIICLVPVHYSRPIITHLEQWASLQRGVFLIGPEIKRVPILLFPDANAMPEKKKLGPADKRRQVKRCGTCSGRKIKVRSRHSPAIGGEPWGGCREFG